jgi:glycosyltransferase involved in cell wall biosynthesis
MARGIATITSSLECFQEFIQHGKNGWIFSLDAPDPVQELSDALRTLTESAELRQSLQREGLRTAREFAVDRIAARYLEDFEDLANA